MKKKTFERLLYGLGAYFVLGIFLGGWEIWQERESDIPRECAESIFAGFDSRLTVEVSGQLGLISGAIHDFVVVQSKPIVAVEKLVLAFDKRSRWYEHELPFDVERLMVGADRSVLAQGRGTVMRVTSQEPVTNGLLTEVSSMLDASIVNDGTNTFLLVAFLEDSTRFSAINMAGETVPIANIEGWNVAATWNSLGMAAVVGPSLFTWNADKVELRRLISDGGLPEVRDVSLVGRNRVVATFRNYVALLTDENQLILAGIPALSYWDGKKLYLLDLRTGVVWSVDGLNDVGYSDKDRRHALSLLGQVSSFRSFANPAFKEASRILGCVPAVNLLSNL